MYTLDPIPLAIFQKFMSQIETGGGGAVSGDAGAGRDFAGRDFANHDNNVNIHFDRAQNWDPEREDLTDRQRIRDLETYVFGDRRGLTVGMIRTVRHYLIWLVILSLFQFLGVVLQAALIWAILRGGT